MLLLKYYKAHDKYSDRFSTNYRQPNGNVRYGSTSCYSICRTNMYKLYCDSYKQVKSMQDVAIEALAEQTRCQ